jgi:hypothetical protein
MFTHSRLGEDIIKNLAGDKIAFFFADDEHAFRNADRPD